MAKVRRQPPGPERPGLRYDRHKFDEQFRGNKYNPEKMYLEELGLTAVTDNLPDDSKLDWEFLSQAITEMGGLPPSERLKKAQAEGKKWAKYATTENILKLPRRQALAMIWFYWGGLFKVDIGSTMRLSTESVKIYLRRAKNSLVEMQKVGNSGQVSPFEGGTIYIEGESGDAKDP